MGTCVIAYDVGTTGIKTCIFEISDGIKLIASNMESYELYVMENGGVEQEPYDWWNAMCSTTKKVLNENNISPERIEGISFCAQMQGLVLVDKYGEPVRRGMSYMDNRAKEELKSVMAKGLQIAGVNVFKLIRSLRISGAVAASVKDPVWKYRWVRKNESDNFKRAYKWLDVKEFLIQKCTGEFVMTEDSAYATLLYDTRSGKKGFSKEICHMLGVEMKHLPRIVGCSEMVGRITSKASLDLGLKVGTPVFGDGGDASLIGVGAAVVMAVGLGIIEGIDDAKKLIKVKERYIPNVNNKVIHDKAFMVFKSLYKNNKKAFGILNN